MRECICVIKACARAVTMAAGVVVAGLLPPVVMAEVSEHRLDNGMRILVKSDNRAPVAVSQLWYMVGGSDEYTGLTGISHLLEHMMFKGTEDYPEDAFSRTMEVNGIQHNAFTSKDYTVYHQTLANDRLDVVLELEADRMRNMSWSEEELEKEMKVVMEERRLRVEDNPRSYTYEVANAVAFQSSPYRYPVVGTNQDLETMGMEDIKKWYRDWYAPNNTLLVVVGDVKADDVFRLAKKNFADIPPSQLAQRKNPREIRQQGVRRVEVKRPANQAMILMYFQAPSLAVAHRDKSIPSWEPYALSVLSDLLSADSSSRLSRSLIRGSGVAVEAWAGYNLLARLDTVFYFSAIPAEEHSVDDVEAAIMEEIEKLQNTPVATEELEKVKINAVAESLYSRDSIYYQAILIGSLESIGLPHQLIEEYPANIKAVTPEQIMQVARKYLKKDALTVAWLNPQPIEGNAPAPQASSGRAH